MIQAITAELLAAAYSVFNTRFRDGMQRGRSLPAGLDQNMVRYLIKFSDLAMNVPSTGEAENHLWITQLPGFTEWVSDRIAETIAVKGLRVVNKDYQQTIKIPRNKFLDEQYGAYGAVMEAMGAEGADDAFWLDLMITALTTNDKWADDLDFYLATRAFGSNTCNNVIDGAITQARIKTAVERMVGFKGEKGKALNVIPAIALCGTTAFFTARKFLEDEKITDDSGNQVDNESRGLLTPRWHPGLYADAWYVLGYKGAVRPLCAQRRQEASALQTLVNPTDPNVFWQKEFVYGTDLRGEGFKPFPFLSVRGSAGTPPSAPAPAKK